jgi:hypothetical protein
MIPSRLLPVVVAGALALAASCSDDEPASTATGPVAQATSGEGTSTTEVDPEGTAPGTAPGTTRRTTTTEATTSTTDGTSTTAELTGFCAELRSLEDLDLDSDPKGALARFEEVSAQAPPELAEPMATMQEALTTMAELDPDDPASLGRMFEVFLDPQVLAATEQINAYAREQCGFDLGLDEGADGGTDGGVIIPSTGGDDTTTTDPADDPTSIDAVQTHLEATYPNGTWVEALEGGASWTVFNDSWVVQSFGDTPMSTSAAIDLCNAIRDYLDGETTGFDISVQDAEGTDLATGSAAQACSSA